MLNKLNVTELNIFWTRAASLETFQGGRVQADRVYRQAVNGDHEVLLFRATPGYKELSVYVELRSHLRAWTFARVSPLVLLSITRTADISNHFAGRQEAYHKGTPLYFYIRGFISYTLFPEAYIGGSLLPDNLAARNLWEGEWRRYK